METSLRSSWCDARVTLIGSTGYVCLMTMSIRMGQFPLPPLPCLAVYCGAIYTEQMEHTETQNAAKMYPDYPEDVKPGTFKVRGR